MTTNRTQGRLGADGLSGLAVADPVNDLCFDHALNRLDGALGRISGRLAGHLDGPARHRLAQAAEVMSALPPAARRAVHTQPYYMYWLVKLYEACVAGDRAACESAMLDVGRFVALHAVRHGVWPADGMTVRVRRGQVRFPGFRSHVLVPEGTPDGPLALRLDDDQLLLNGPGCDIRVPAAELLDEAPVDGGSPVARRPLIPGTSIEVDGTDPFVAELFASMNSRPSMANYPPRDLAPMPYVSSEVLEHLGAVCRLIRTAWPAAGAELMHYTRLFVPFVSRCYSTFAEAAFLGAVFMGESRHPFTDVMYTAEHLLHEHSHLRLHLIMEQDPVFEADRDLLVSSPWRRDPRPVIGIVQGVFVFARVARFLRSAYHHLGEERYAKRHAEVAEDTRRGLELLFGTEEVRLTPLGTVLLEQCQEEIDTLVTTAPAGTDA
ncbi:aKG-HExxH-type peptide beta-hydroxylase [Nonomuraea sp. NPDC004297]